MDKLYCRTFRAPINIAVIKYWGKTDERLIIPTNDSLSLTLSVDQLCATTTITTSSTFEKDRFWLNGEEKSTDSQRIQSCLKSMREAAMAVYPQSGVDPRWPVHIYSENNFPTAAGLASSAAGYACLVVTLQNLYGLQGNFSSVARKGSGSACRSMFGGFVRWHKGTVADGSKSVARQVVPASAWPEIRVLICVVNDLKKDTGSTEGMRRSVETSDLLKFRAESVVPHRIERMEKAISEKDFDTFARITMQDSNQFHAICQDTFPPIRYMNEVSWEIVSLVHMYNSKCGSNRIAYTFDAGPNAFLFCLEHDVLEVLQVLQRKFPSSRADYIRGLYNNDSVKGTDLGASRIPEVNPAPKDSLKYIITTKGGDGPCPSDEHIDISDDSLPKTEKKTHGH